MKNRDKSKFEAAAIEKKHIVFNRLMFHKNKTTANLINPYCKHFQKYMRGRHSHKN